MRRKMAAVLGTACTLVLMLTGCVGSMPQGPLTNISAEGPDVWYCNPLVSVQGPVGVVMMLTNTESSPVTVQTVELVEPENLRKLDTRARLHDEDDKGYWVWHTPEDFGPDETPFTGTAEGFVLEPGVRAEVAVIAELEDPSSPASARQLRAVYELDGRTYHGLSNVSVQWDTPEGCDV